MNRRWSGFWGSIHLGVSVAAGAFGAHGLKKVLEADLLQIFETGVRYQMIHGLALLILGVWGERSFLARTSARFFHWGIFLFSGSLYVLALSGIRWLGAVTPLGGILFLLGWALWAAAWWIEVESD